MNFASDTTAPAHPAVLAALARVNAGHAPSYGSDPWTREVETRIGALLDAEVAIGLVTTGTAANSLAIAQACPSWGAALTHAEAHVAIDECGGPEFHTQGAKVVGLPGRHGKIDAATLRETLAWSGWGAPRNVAPAVLSLTQATEVGTVYGVAEVEELAGLARAKGLAVHIDGARFANALVHLGVEARAFGRKAGVGLMSFGFSKNAAMGAEAIVILDEKLRAGFIERRKRAGLVTAKSRFIAAQVLALLEDDLWLELARKANGAARRLAEGIAAAGYGIGAPVEANEVFPLLPLPVAAAIRAKGGVFYDWSSASFDAVPEGVRPVRLVTSYATTDAEIEGFLAALGAGA